MRRRRLGRTGYEVGMLGLGGHTYPVHDGPGAFRTPDRRARLVARLVAAGANYFDTTWFNEAELLADSFRRAGVGHDAVVSLQYVDGISDPNWRANLRREVESRLALFGYARAPLFLMGVGNGKPGRGEIEAALHALADLRAEGLVVHIGLSCHEIGHFGVIADVIERTGLPDYLMLRLNPKFPQATERLLPVAAEHDVGVVAMKVFCWDCGPGEWGRRISVFEPLSEAERTPDACDASGRALRWVWNRPPVAVAVPAMNAEWEVEANLRAVASAGLEDDEAGFDAVRDRLWRHDSCRELAERAESQTIRDRAEALLPSLSGPAHSEEGP